MNKQKTFTFLSVMAMLAAAVPAHAGMVLFNSRPGLATSAGPSTVAITPHPAWQANNPANPGDPSDTSAVWISHIDSGYGGSQFQPYQGTTPVVSIFDSFTSGDGVFNLNVWADDTVEVFLDGVSLISPKFTQSSCSGQPVGCLPEDGGFFSLSIGAGLHTLEFVLYQVGQETNTTGNPFGLLYTGSATAPDTATPEPGALLLTGLGLVAVGVVRRQSASK